MPRSKIKIYTLPFPATPVDASSVFTHLWSVSTDNLGFVGQYLGELTAYVAAETGTALSRTQGRDLSLRVRWALIYNRVLQARRGDMVMIFSLNSLSWPVVLFGAVTAGLRCTLANSAYTPKELKFQYEYSGAKLVFVAEKLIPVVFEMFRLLSVAEHEARKRVVVMETGLEWAGWPPVSRVDAAEGLETLADLINAGGKLDHEERLDGAQANETVYLCYSSGTTGKPKGVETTHLNINLVQESVKPPFPRLSPGKDLYSRHDTRLPCLRQVMLLQFPILCGVPVVIMLRFDPIKFCAHIERYRITTALIMPPVLVALARHPAVDKYDVSSLEVLSSGAVPVGPDFVKQATNRLHARHNGKGDFAIVQGYGPTETSPTAHLLPTPDAIRKVGSISILLPNLEARLVADGDNDAEAKEGEPGELWIRGPPVMKGYPNNAVATKDSITPNGWFKTGDVVVGDLEGYYSIVDRRKELIKYKGFQVPPAELEALLLNHPDVADTAVSRVYHEGQAAELPRLERRRIKSRSGRMWAWERVPRHKFLRGGVVIIDVIPKSAAGKIIRRELRERAKIELKGQDPATEEVRVKL